jgi:hypothetical protein
MEKIHIVAVLVASLSVVAVAAKSTSQANYFYVYSDKGARTNHFAPSGWMGDYGDIKLNDASALNPADGRTAIMVTYSAKGSQGANWSGMFWQHPPNNWGEKPGGYDLSAFKRLTFWARGEKGGEKIAEFKTGGITGQYGDSDTANIGPVVLTTDWKKYTIDLAGRNLSHVVGGFCWAASRDDNPEGFVMHLDEVRFE